jgi:hypothetical protein
MYVGPCINRADFWCELHLISEKILELPDLWILTIVSYLKFNTSENWISSYLQVKGWEGVQVSIDLGNIKSKLFTIAGQPVSINGLPMNVR